MKDFWGLSTIERVMLGVCLIAILICSYILTQDDFFRSRTDNRTTPLMGKVVYLKNQVRHRTDAYPLWQDSFKNQNVRLKDSIFNGDNAHSRVQLEEGGDVEIGPNSLIVFDKISDKSLPDFRIGNYLLKVKGKMNLAIQGNVTTLEGDGSEVQVFIKKSQKPQIRLIKGNAVIKEKNKPARPLKINAVVTLVTPPVPRTIASKPTQEELEIEEKELVVESAPEVPKPQKLRLYDLYERDGQNLKLKPVVSATHPYLENEVQLSKSETSDLILKDNYANTVLEIASHSDLNGFALDISTDPSFAPTKTRSYWTNKRKVQLDFKKPGRLFYRVHGVNKSTEITAPTPSVEVVVLPEPVAVMPLAKVEALDVGREQKDEAPRKLRPLKIASTKKSTLKAQKKYAPPKSIEEPLDTVNDESDNFAPLRRSASINEATITEKMPEPIEYLNEDFSSSSLELNSGSFSTFSQEEKDVGRDKPTVYSLGLRSKHWFGGKHGIESSIKMKAADGNDTAKGIDPLQLEGRYHYMLSRNFLGPSSTSVIGGYEFYRNAGRGFFSQKYDLFKLGLSCDRPILARWTLGAETLYGFNSSQSRKYELQGRIYYYFRRKWSLGFAYRLHLFEAGDEKNAPFDVPYKESQSEGLLLIRWQY